MMNTTIIPESKKIEALRDLLSLVVENTKREIQGKAAKTEREQRLLATNLELLLGRRVEPAEVAKVHY